MKKIFVSLFLTLTILSSCNDDFLDRQPLDALTNESYWETEAQVELAVNACYDYLKDRNTVDLEQLGDNTIWPFLDDYRRISGGNYSSDLDNINTEWAEDYDGIRRCNEFLANYQKAELDEETAARYVAEVRFIRAYLYSYLTSFFGDVQLVTEPLDINDSVVYGERQSKEVVVDFILDELDAIADNLPLSYEEFGRITKGAALALKSRVALFNQRYEIAELAAKAVMDLGVYELYSNGNPATSYNELFTYAGRASRNASNQETILARVHLVEVSTHNLSRELWVPDEYIRWNPTKSLADAYLCSDGLPIGKSPLYSEATYAAMFENRDPRMPQTILPPGTPWGGQDDGDLDSEPDAEFNLPKFKADKKGAVTITGYYFYKYVEPSTVGVGNSDENDIIIIRYAEVLLNYAEALLEQGKLTQADLDMTINLLRARVGMVPMNINQLTANGMDLREEVRRERRVELALEGLRYFDILRWEAGDQLAADIKGINVSLIPEGQNVTELSFDQNGYIITEGNRTFEAPKNYLWPVPFLQRERNPNLGDNPGW